MSSSSILFERVGGVAKITLNRPDVLNSFNTAMSQELQGVLREVAAAPELRAVYLTGAGRAFCAGQDLAEAAPPGGQPLADFAAHVRRSYNPLIRAIRHLEKPVVCAVNGVAAGAGANLALACDLVFAAEEASFLQAFVNIGLVPDTGGTWFLPRLVGLAQASAMMILGEKVLARRAFELGMVYQVVPLASLEAVAWGVAQRLATQPTFGIGLTKRLLNASLESTLEQQLEAEAEHQGIAGRSADYAEGVQAFLQKRKPAFRGA